MNIQKIILCSFLLATAFTNAYHKCCPKYRRPCKHCLRIKKSIKKGLYNCLSNGKTKTCQKMRGFFVFGHKYQSFPQKEIKNFVEIFNNRRYKRNQKKINPYFVEEITKKNIHAIAQEVRNNIWWQNLWNRLFG